MIHKAYKTEINPTLEQKYIINQTIGVCRYLQNLYIEKRNQYYKDHQKKLTVNNFDQWYRKEYLLENPDKAWIKEVSSKSRKRALEDVNQAYDNFYAGRARLPKFKRKHDQEGSMYFVRNDKNHRIECLRHRIKIPTLGFVRLKEKGYLPTDAPIISGRITKRAGRYYVSVIVETDIDRQYFSDKDNYSDGQGIDVGIKDLAICSNGAIYPNINQTSKVKRIEKQLRKQQRKLSKKLHNRKEDATNKNIAKQTIKVQKLHQRLTNIRTNYENQVINQILKEKPKYITLETLNIAGMLRNKHLSKSIQQQRLFSFTNKLTDKAVQSGIEVRKVSTFYPSSKLCASCGFKKSDLKLSDRIYHCDLCGYTNDRDMNAAINLKQAEEYLVVE